MAERKVLIGDEARNFYNEKTKDFKFANFGKELAAVGGYWTNDTGIHTAFDFTDGSEVFIEDFFELTEAVKYANGVEALTIDNILI